MGRLCVSLVSKTVSRVRILSIKRIFPIFPLIKFPEDLKILGRETVLRTTKRKDAPFRFRLAMFVVLGDNAAVSDDSRSFGR